MIFWGCVKLVCERLLPPPPPPAPFHKPLFFLLSYLILFARMDISTLPHSRLSYYSLSTLFFMEDMISVHYLWPPKDHQLCNEYYLLLKIRKVTNCVVMLKKISPNWTVLYPFSSHTPHVKIYQEEKTHLSMRIVPFIFINDLFAFGSSFKIVRWYFISGITSWKEQ